MTPDQASREKAVQLRLAGQTLRSIAAQTGLSAPTVSALVRAYERGGWEAVRERKRGRPAGGYQGGQHDLATLKHKFFESTSSTATLNRVFSMPELAKWLTSEGEKACDERAAKRRLAGWNVLPPDAPNTAGTLIEDGTRVLYWARGPKGELFVLPSLLPLTDDAYCRLSETLHRHFPKGLKLSMEFAGLKYTPKLQQWLQNHPKFHLSTTTNTAPSTAQTPAITQRPTLPAHRPSSGTALTHLQRLEAESIAIMREVVAESDNPVMLYSIGKDSAVMLHLAVKAFYPAKIPFPLLHVDTKWKFQDMYRFRARMQEEHDFKLLVHTNPEGLAQGINPFTHGSQIHTDIMKTVALKQALDKYGFDVAFGGARRDEEKSRAKERVFSFRTKDHRWDPKNQRPELWSLYNTKKHKGESIRVFPISNWTELDIWQYIYLEDIPIVPLYFSAPRPVVNRDGTLIMVDDDRMPLAPAEVPMMKSVRFRTLGCYPLTGAVESKAETLEEVIQEMLLTKTSERQGRMIDHDSAASMEKKKQEGYF